MTIPSDTSITIERSGVRASAIVTQAAVNLIASQMQIHATSGVTAVELRNVQTMIGSWINLRDRALAVLSTVPDPEVGESFILFSMPPGGNESDIVVGGLTIDGNIELNIGTDFTDNSRSHDIDSLFKILVSKWIEIGKSY